jgi:hypothetical protein
MKSEKKFCLRADLVSIYDLEVVLETTAILSRHKNIIYRCADVYKQVCKVHSRLVGLTFVNKKVFFFSLSF